MRCWVAPRDILPGQEWAESILRAIEASRLMVLVFSDHTNNSTHVRKEVERAVHHGLAVAPVRLTEALPAASLEYFLSSSHWLDAITPPLDRHLAELTRKVTLLLGGAPAPPAPPRDAGVAAPAPGAAAGGKAPLRVGAAVALAVVACGLFAAWRLGRIGNSQAGRSSAVVAVPPTTNVRPATPAAGDPPGSTAPGGQGQAAAAGTVLPAMIEVSTAEELVRAIGPDRILLLKAGEYVLTDVADEQKEFVRWDRKFDGKSMTIRNVKNFSIVGTGDTPVRLVVRPSYVFVLNFEKCQDVHLTNLTMGHAPKKGECDCGVLGATACTGVTIRKCDLFGCGAEGLTLRNVRNLKFLDSTVRDCGDGIMTVDGCTGLSFARSRFVGNSRFWGIKIDDTKDVSFSDCDVENNTLADESIFHVTSSTGVEFDGGRIQNNHASALMEDADTVTITNAAVENNEFSRH